MNRVKWISSIVILLQILITSGYALDFSAKQPILITSAGQSADVLMVKILAKKAGLQFTFDKLAQPDQLKDQKSMIFVSGGSTKGLGAAKIDKQDEINRVLELIKAAKDAKVDIIAMHMGGKARRGKLSDEFNRIAAENADCLIVVESGDDDKFFTNIAKEKKIPIKLIEKIMDAGNVLKGVFTEPEK